MLQLIYPIYSHNRNKQDLAAIDYLFCVLTTYQMIDTAFYVALAMYEVQKGMKKLGYFPLVALSLLPLQKLGCVFLFFFSQLL